MISLARDSYAMFYRDIHLGNKIILIHNMISHFLNFRQILFLEESHELDALNNNVQNNLYVLRRGEAKYKIYIISSTAHSFTITTFS